MAMRHRIFNTEYETEKTSKYWAQMMVILIHQTRQCPRIIAQYHYCPSFVNCSRVKKKTEEAIGENEFSFIQGRKTEVAILTVRQKIEKAKEHQVSLHFNFINFKATFDTMGRKALHKMLIAICIDPS